ncbi:hypothetical protein FRX31_011988, partial [Thalictrum thalictroides]
MMGRDEIQVGVGGEGGILPNGNILPNVGGYLPIIDQAPLAMVLFLAEFHKACIFTVPKYVVKSQ